MSGAVGVSSYSMLDQLLASADSLSTQYANLQQEVSTGLVSQSYSGVASSSTQVLDLAATIDQNNAYTQNINQGQAQVSVVQNVLTQVGSLVSAMSSNTVQVTAQSSSDTVTSLAQQASDDLSQIASLLNTTYEGNYVFSGADTANPAITNPEGVTTSGMFSNVGSMVAAFTGGATTASAATLISNASSIMATGTIFSPYLTAAATSAVTPQQVEIGPSDYVTVGMPATQNVGGETSSSGVGSALTDIMGGLAVIANGASAATNPASYATLMQSVTTALNQAGNSLAQEAGYLGQSQDAMTAAASTQSSAQTALSTQMSNLTNVDMATAISHMQQVETQLQTSYTVLGEVSKLNLASYL